MKDDLLYLNHMLECIERIEKFTSSGEENFLSDIKTQDAVLRNLHTLSESSQKISEKLKNNQSDIQWRALRACP